MFRNHRTSNSGFLKISKSQNLQCQLFVKFLESEEPPTVINELVVLTYEPAKNQWLRISSLSF
jgi:hypothetical protein